MNTTLFQPPSLPPTEQAFLNLTFSYTTLTIILSIILLYCIYYYNFRQAQFIIKPQYNQNKKKIGKPLPPYPNGWYVACHSKDLKPEESKAIDIAGENIVLFREKNTNKVHALHAYCAHMGAHLGIGGKVVNNNCIQCPFHGWLYNGQTGTCVDHNNKPLSMRTAQYTQGFCKQHGQLHWKQGQQSSVSLRKFPTQQTNDYIYIWIHSMTQHQSTPQYPNIPITKLTKKLQYRGRTIHHIMCHIQDVPENGSDILHFKYVHTQIIPKIDWLSFSWKAKWKRGDDADIKQMFEHEKDYVRQYKQQIYRDFIQPFKNTQFLSIGYIDNYLTIPFIGNCFMFNATIVQYGPATVFIFLRSPLYKVAFQQFIQPQSPTHQIIYHQMYTNSYIPYWLSALAIKLEGDQVTNDMYLWESKQFATKLYYRKGMQYDDCLQNWRKWYSRNYEGCAKQLEKPKDYTW